MGIETCDDGKGDTWGCKDTCVGVRKGWHCQKGSSTKASVCDPICGDGILVGEEPCDDGILGDELGCDDDCSGPLSGWNCTRGNEDKPSNCSLLNSLQTVNAIAQASTYLGFAASIMTSVGSLSMGPGTFLIVNSIAIS